MQHENLDVRSVGTTRPLRGVAFFDETCDLTDGDAQEAAIRACCSGTPGIIIVGIPSVSLEEPFRIHKVVYLATRARCPLHHDPDRFRGCPLALETLHRSEGSAWLGRDLRQVGTGARLDSDLPAMSRARVWTNSFHFQQEAIAREGPLHSEELFPFAENCDTR